MWNEKLVKCSLKAGKSCRELRGSESVDKEKMKEN